MATQIATVRGSLSELSSGVPAGTCGPELRKSRALIECRPDADLERTDLVIYDTMLAIAMQGRGAEEFSAPAAQLAGMANVSVLTVRRSVARLDGVAAHYDVLGKCGREWARLTEDRVPMISCSLADGVVSWAYPPGLAGLILDPVPYSWIELSAASRMRTRAGWRLYQWCAIRANHTPGKIDFRTWKISRSEFYGILGIDDSTLWNTAWRSIIKDAIDDVSKARRFLASFEFERGHGRGHPVTGVTVSFHVTDQDVRKLRTPDGATDEYDAVKSMAMDAPEYCVSAYAFIKVAGWLASERRDTRHSVENLIGTWNYAIDDAIKNPCPADAASGLRRAQLLHRIRTAGADQAMMDFCKMEADLGWPTEAEIAGRYGLVMEATDRANERAKAARDDAVFNRGEATRAYADAVAGAAISALSLPPIEEVFRPALPAAPTLPPEPEYTPPDEHLPIQRVVIRIDWRRLAVARGVAPEVSRAVLAWRTAGRTPEATEALREALDDIAFRAMADREISALAWIEMHPSRPGGRSIQVSIATANRGAFEDDGRLIIHGRAEDVREIDRPFIVHRGDIEQFERENPGVRVLMYA